jgi:hypothetical protein
MNKYKKQRRTMKMKTNWTKYAHKLMSFRSWYNQQERKLDIFTNLDIWLKVSAPKTSTHTLALPRRTIHTDSRLHQAKGGTCAYSYKESKDYLRMPRQLDWSNIKSKLTVSSDSITLCRRR